MAGGAVDHELVVPPVHRVEPRCAHFGPCGGCTWQHVEYAEQLRLKRSRVQEIVTAALGGPEVLPTLPTPAPGGGTPWGYRDKVSFVFARGGRGEPVVMGHYRRGSHSVLPVRECPVHAEAGNRFAFGLRESLARARVEGAASDGSRGVARHVVVRVSESTGDLVGTLVATGNAKALRAVTADMQARFAEAGAGEAPPRVGFHLNIHDRPGSLLFGRETRRLFGLAGVRERVGSVSYLVSPTSFFQTNVRAAEVLVRTVLEALADERYRRVLDLYAGVGLFALPLAKAGRAVTAVEENRDAVSGAAAALRLNRIPADACRLVASRVEDALGRLAGRRPTGRRGARPAAGAAWDAVVLDPPRQGCPPKVLDLVLRSIRPARVVYVSCDADALARDLARVPGTGYVVDRVQPIDMFPHTEHVETVVVLNAGPARL